MKNRFAQAAAAALLGVGLLGYAQTARASMQFQLVVEELDANNNVIATSNPQNWDGVTFNAQGQAKLTFTGTVGDFGVDTTVAASNSPGSWQKGALLKIGTTDITNLNNLSGGSHTIRVSVSATDYSAPSSPADIAMSSNFHANIDVPNTSASGSYTSYLGSGNLLYQQSYAAPTISFALSGANTSFDQTTYNPHVSGTTYSLSSVGVFTLSEGANLHQESGTTQVTAPEPATVSMAVAGLVVFAGARWGRRRRQDAV